MTNDPVPNDPVPNDPVPNDPVPNDQTMPKSETPARFEMPPCTRACDGVALAIRNSLPKWKLNVH